MTGRIRPLLIWLGPHNVGDARLRWRRSTEGTTQLELLIGTDPERAPRKINRWGYLAETQCGTNAGLIGLMTESDEASLEEAQTRVEVPGATGPPFKVIRSTLAGVEARTEIVSLRPASPVAYRQLDSVLAMLPPPGPPRAARMEAGVSPGFLDAIAGLLRDSVVHLQMTGRAVPTLRRTYVYGGRLYDVTLSNGTVLFVAGAGGRSLQSDFEVRNRSTGEVSRFQITYGSSGDLAEAPLRVVYRPRWWLELELTLRG